MKPASELVTKWLENAKNPRTDGTIAYNECADELQAWLREADEYLRVEAKLCEGAAETRSGDVKQHYGGRIFSCHRFREVLLGTTRQEDGK